MLKFANFSLNELHLQTNFTKVTLSDFHFKLSFKAHLGQNQDSRVLPHQL